MSELQGLTIGGSSIVAMIPIDLIDVNGWNPNAMQQSKFSILRDKIKSTGVVKQPILVFRNGDRFTIADGEHRYRAAAEAGHEEVPSVIVDITEEEAKIETIAMNNLRGEYIPIKMAELVVSLKETYTEEQIRSLTGMDKDEVASLSALLEVGDFSFDDVPVIAPEHKETPIPVHLVLFPQQYKEYQASLELAVEIGGGMVTPLVGEQVIEYDKAMKSAFNMAGVQLRNKGLATVCAVFNAIPKEDKEALLAAVLEKNPDLLKG